MDPRTPIRVLYVEDDPIDRMAFSREIKLVRPDWEIIIAKTVREGLNVLQTDKVDAVVGDYNLPDGSVFDLLKAVAGTDMPLVVLTGHGSEEVAVSAMKNGAEDYLIKDDQRNYLSILPRTLEKTIQSRRSASDIRWKEALIAQITRSAPFGQYVLDQGGKEILFVNPRFSEIWDPSGKDPELQVHSLTHSTVLPALLSRVSDPGEYSRIWERLEADPSGDLQACDLHLLDLRTIRHSSTHVTDTEGRVYGRLHIFEDITERLALETELLNNQRLESIGVLAGGIAHEFNNMLTGVIGQVSLVRQGLIPGGEAEIRLGKAEVSLLRATDLTKRLLTFAQGGAPVREGVTLDLFLPRIIHEISQTLVHPVDLIMPGRSGRVLIDPGQLTSAIHAIILNADEASPINGKIWIDLQESLGEIPPLDAVSGLRIRIRDNGPGMDEGVYSHALDPFFSTKNGHSGLGLSTAYSILAQHGGTLTVRSQPGEGTEVSIWIPLYAEIHEASEVGNASVSVQKETCLKILVMDDEEPICDISSLALTRAGHTVTTCTKGEEALEIMDQARNHGVPFDLIILDLLIPEGMGGKETIMAVREVDDKVYAIVSSGYSNDPVMAEYRRFGFDAVLPKPYKLQDLTHLVGTIHTRRPD